MCQSSFENFIALLDSWHPYIVQYMQVSRLGEYESLVIINQRLNRNLSILNAAFFSLAVRDILLSHHRGFTCFQMNFPVTFDVYSLD